MAQSPLWDVHARLGARFVDFAGWEMPVQYAGVLAEHEAVRSAAGVFDVSHLGRFRLEGPGSTKLLRNLLCNDVSAVEPGRAQYTMALNESGGVEDDIIVWRWEAERYWVIPNGANDARIRASFEAAAGAEVTIEDLRETTALLAVQGPEAPAAIETVLGKKPGRFRLFEECIRRSSGLGGRDRLYRRAGRRNCRAFRCGHRSVRGLSRGWCHAGRPWFTRYPPIGDGVSAVGAGPGPADHAPGSRTGLGRQLGPRLCWEGGVGTATGRWSRKTADRICDGRPPDSPAAPPVAGRRCQR